MNLGAGVGDDARRASPRIAAGCGVPARRRRAGSHQVHGTGGRGARRRGTATPASRRRCRGHARARRRLRGAHRRLPAGAVRRPPRHARSASRTRAGAGSPRACSKRTVAALGGARRARASDLVAWLGPAIGPRAFEVGADVRDAFLARRSRAPTRISCAQRAGQMARRSLRARAAAPRACGVHAVGGGGFCTMTDATRFFSYRRDRDGGRMAALVWLAPDGASTARIIRRALTALASAPIPPSSVTTLAADRHRRACRRRARDRSPRPARWRCIRRGSRGSCRSRSARCSAPCSSSSCRMRSKTGGAERVMITVLVGLLAFFLLEKLVLWRHAHGHDQHDDDAEETEHEHALHAHGGADQGRSGLMILIGTSVHNFCDGVVIAAAFLAEHDARRRDDGRDRRARGAAAGRRFRRARAFGLRARAGVRVQRRGRRRHAGRRARRLLRAGRHAADACRRCSRSPRRACSTSRSPT